MTTEQAWFGGGTVIAVVLIAVAVALGAVALIYWATKTAEEREE